MSSKEKIREQALLLNPIDDAMFVKMAEKKPFCQEILRTFLEEPNLVVISNSPQKILKNLEGRSIRVDLVCNLSGERIVNVEVEKNSLDHLRRVRYHSSIITTNVTDTGIEFDDIPNVIVIYLTKSDIFI